MGSNYEKMRDEMSSRFLTMDPDRAVAAFGLESDDGFIYLTYLGEEFRISRLTGIAENRTDSGGFSTADFGDSMTIFDILTFSGAPVAASGEYIDLGSLSSLTGAYTAVSPAGFFLKQERMLTGRVTELKKALERPGWIPSGGADASCMIDVFNGLKVIFRFWDMDEDFPAKIQFMWDRNVLTLMHYETVWFASSSILRRIIDAMAIG